MFRTLVLVAVLTTNLVGSEHYDEKCQQIEDDGFYCTSDLKSYQDCAYQYDSMYLGLRSETQCPEGTRCSCHIDYPCAGNTTAVICQPFTIPAPLVDSFALSYTRHVFHRSYNPDVEGYEHYEETKEGVVIGDVHRGTYYKKEGQESRIIMQNGEGRLIKYVWTEEHPDKCRQWTFKPFSDIQHFGIDEVYDHFIGRLDMTKYALLSSHRVGKNVQQKWYLQTGRDSWAYDFKKRTMTVLYDTTTQKITPVKYYEEFIEGEGDYDHFTTITWKKLEGDGQVPQVPHNC